jgi:hypothetical protein
VKTAARHSKRPPSRLRAGKSWPSARHNYSRLGTPSSGRTTNSAKQEGDWNLSQMDIAMCNFVEINWRFIGQPLRDYMAKYRRRQSSSYSPLWYPKSHKTITVFRYFRLCILVEINRRFGGLSASMLRVIVLIMEALRTSETWVSLYQTTLPSLLHIVAVRTWNHWSLSRAGIVQSVPCTAVIFWPVVRPHLSSYHSLLIH